MADVDFSDRESAERWFGGQTPETRCVMSSRAVLRVLSNISLVDAAHFEHLTLICFRAVLTSAARGLGIGETVLRLDAAAAQSEDSLPHSLVRLDQGTPIDPFAASNVFSAAVNTTRANYSAHGAANSIDEAIKSAIHIDGFAVALITVELNSDQAALNTTASDLFKRPVWAYKTAPKAYPLCSGKTTC
ncbi:hypothetical protein [Tateyamaria pelophila]|uniref:hypothetical protein n=1 Tax=Tateyamaria pelophila TaxID=328415 RepID=UPI001CBB607D|nr:hypothetical protein [Tateyamaria pelophila]